MEKLICDIKKVSIYDIAVFLLYLSCGMIIITSLLFIIGIEIGWMNFIFPLLFTCLFFMYRETDIQKNIWIILISLVIFFLVVSMSAQVFDYTCDGTWYHKTAVGLLKDGWNPLFMSAEKYNSMSGSNLCARPVTLKWVECYPKGTWYFAGVIYFLTGNVEAGKAYTMIYMIILFGIIYQYVVIKLEKRWKAILIACLGALNPIAVCQMQTYYNDGIAGCILLALMLQLLLLFEKDYIIKREELYINVAALIIIGCNLKFQITLFVALVCIAAFLISVIEHRSCCIKLFIYFGISAFIAIAVVGMAPYITNIIRHGNILYGFVGLFSEGGLEQNFGISGLSGSAMAIASLFGHMGFKSYDSLEKLLKFPFTFSKDELYYYSIPDPRTGGFGIFFSGLLIISIVVIICYIIKKKRKAIHEIAALVFIGITVAELLCLQGTFQVRYMAHFYMILLIACYLLLKKSEMKGRQRFNTVLVSFLAIMAIANIFPWFSLAGQRLKEGELYRTELMKLAQEDETDITIAFVNYDYSGLYYNLRDYGIEGYTFVDKEELTGDIKNIYGYYISYSINRSE